MLSVPSNPIEPKDSQHFEGHHQKILVADGDVVRAGQILISLEDTRPVPKFRPARSAVGRDG